MKKIDWVNHTFEFAVVLIGILLAFQLNTCSSENKQNTTINIHLSEIKEETESNQKNLEAIISQSQRNSVLLDSLIAMISQSDFDQLSEANSITFQLMNIGKVYLRKNAYRSLIESGDIRFINDFEVKSRIINLYEFYAWVENIEKIAINNYDQRFFPYISENMDLIGGNIQQKEVYTSKKFMNALATYRYMVKNKLEKYKICLNEVEDYLESAE